MGLRPIFCGCAACGKWTWIAIPHDRDPATEVRTFPCGWCGAYALSIEDVQPKGPGE